MVKGRYNIVNFIEDINKDGQKYIVTHYYPKAEELFDVISKSKNGLEEKIARHIFKEIVDAVIYTHEKELIHGDLKPENFLFLPETNQTVLIDFGFAYNPKTKKDGALGGTPNYWPPSTFDDFDTAIQEREKAEAIANFGELWSLGVTLFVMLTRQLPAVTKTGVVTLKFLNKPWDYPNMSKNAENLIKQMITYHPNTQPQIRLDEILKHEWFEIKKQLSCKDLQKKYPESCEAGYVWDEYHLAVKIESILIEKDDKTIQKFCCKKSP
jgi:serine/threonine protein kinase